MNFIFKRRGFNLYLLLLSAFLFKNVHAFLNPINFPTVDQKMCVGRFWTFYKGYSRKDTGKK